MALNPALHKKKVVPSALMWMRHNLFSSWGNTLLTLIGLLFLAWTVPPFIRWAFINATWLGDSRTACDAVAPRAGACWVFIKVRLSLFIYGFFPEAQRFRVDTSFAVLAGILLPLFLPRIFGDKKRQILLFCVICIGIACYFSVTLGIISAVYFAMAFGLARISFKPVFFRPAVKELTAWSLAVLAALTAGVAAFVLVTFAGQEAAGFRVGVSVALVVFFLCGFKTMPVSSWQWILALTVYPVFAYTLFLGDVFGLPLVETHFWGGLFLTLVIACTGIVTSIPIGILLALGRRSHMGAIKVLCIFFIELVRGVPLVSVLFMASVMFPLFLPEGAHFDKLLRALIGVALFYAAYIAEIIRGGLQAIPKGQYEAAEALGWGYWRMMIMIIIPQVLRLVIPGLANNVLSLFKDTTLVAVIGLLDLLGVAKAAMADAEWLGFTKEAYVFAGAVFWVMCFSISRYSIYLERKYHASYQQ